MSNIGDEYEECSVPIFGLLAKTIREAFNEKSCGSIWAFTETSS